MIIGDIIGGLFGRNSNKRTNSTNKDIAETPTRTTSIDQMLRDIMQSTDQSQSRELMEQLFGTETMDSLRNVMEQMEQEQSATTEQTTEQTTTRGTEQSQEALAQLTEELGGSTDARMQTAIDQVLRSGMPAVSNTTAGGGFDNTTTALLQNDLAARAAAAGLQAEDAQRAQLLQAIGAGQAGTETTEGLSAEEVLQQLTGSTNTTDQTEQTGTTTQNRDVSEDTDTTTETSTTENTVNLGDSFTNPGDNVRVPAGTGLGDLIAIGETSRDLDRQENGPNNTPDRNKEGGQGNTGGNTGGNKGGNTGNKRGGGGSYDGGRGNQLLSQPSTPPIMQAVVPQLERISGTQDVVMSDAGVQPNDELMQLVGRPENRVIVEQAAPQSGPSGTPNKRRSKRAVVTNPIK